MKIPTANVVVAFDLTTMERLFSAGATYKSLVAELEKGNANGLLFDNVSNPNFIEFEHDFALNKSQFVLSFIDPNDEFETRFFSENPVRLFQGYSSSSMGLSKSFSTDKPLDVKQSQEDYSKEFIAETKKLLENTYREKEIYVAYGTGNNLDLWSGPHRTTLVGADITVKGAKKVTLKMAAIPSPLDTDQRRGMYNEKLDLDLHGLSMRFAGESQEIKFLENKTYDPTEYIENNRLSEEVQRYQDETSEALANLGFENLSDKLEKFDFHCIVVDALRNYIQKATNNRNVIVLLPNLNVVCRQVISDMARQYSLLQPLGQATEAVAGALFGNFVKSRVSDLFTKSDTILGNEEMFLEGTLKSFGLRLHSGDRQSAETLQKQAIPTGEVAAFALPEKFPSARDAVRKYYEDRYFTAVIDKTDKKIPDHMRIVKDIYNNIKKLSQESYMMSTFASIVETDINLLKLWGNNTGTGRWGKYYTLAGYDDFDPTGNAVIVGDLALIKEYLYGSIDLKTMSDSIKKLKMQSKKTKVKKIKGDGFFAKAANAIAGAPSRSLGFQAATKHPIHPMDRVLLTNHTFNKKVRDITFPRIEDTTGSFGNISYIPDDFAYKDAEFSKEEKKYIEENAIPIFRYNTENPNILDLKIKAGTIYFDMLKSGYQKEIRRLTSAVAEGILPTGTGSFPIRSRGAAIQYLRSKGFSHGLGNEEKQEIINELASRVSPELAEEINADSAEIAADFFAAKLEQLEKENLHGLVLVDQELPGNPNSILADQAEDLYRRAFNLSITTLPTFHISNLWNINSPCIVFAQDQPIITSTRRTRKLMNKFFSGLYKIMGYKHTITTGSATSEFRLVKNAPKFKDKKDEDGE